MASESLPGIRQRFVDYTGQRYGRWIVLSFIGNNYRGDRLWLCRCDCGIERVVKGGILRSGESQSCGCLNKEKVAEACRKRSTIHRETVDYKSTPEYNAWLSLKGRCLNPRNSAFQGYGGRGIMVCDRWVNSFPNFLEDVGRRPSPQHSIDRFPNNDGNYEPGNVRWATRTEQNRNKRSVLLIDGKTLPEWETITGINRKLAWARIHKLGWPHYEAVTTQPQKQRKSNEDRTIDQRRWNTRGHTRPNPLLA